jgi:hypothetical protein
VHTKPSPTRTCSQLVDEDNRPLPARQYLENALQEVRGSSEKAVAKNRIRTMIRHFFPERNCFPMVRPVEDEMLLQTLDAQPEVPVLFVAVPVLFVAVPILFVAVPVIVLSV